MKRDEFQLAVCLLGTLLLAIFARPISHTLNQPVLPRIEALLHPVHGSHGALSSHSSRKVPVREETTRG